MGSELNVLNSTFIRSRSAAGSGAIHLQKSVAATISQCLFINCSAPTVVVDSQLINMTDTIISTRDDTLSTFITLKGEVVRIKSSQISIMYPKTVQSNVIQNMISATSPSDIDISGGINITCSPNFNVAIEETNSSLTRNATTLEFKCVSCNSDFYTVTNSINVKSVLDTGSCKPCPPGAICNGEIKSLDNFWGKAFDTNLQMFHCPEAYCCSSSTTPCVCYDTCHAGRTGVFCGGCDKGYVQAFMSDACILISKTGCNITMFILYFFIMSQVYTITFTFFPSMIRLLKDCIQQIKRKSSNDLMLSDEFIKEDVNNDNAIPIAAYITLIIFYYQICAFVHVDVLTQNNASEEESKNFIIKVMSDVSSLKLTLNQELCPFNDLNYIEKQFINLGLKMNTMMNLVWFLILWRTFTLFKCRGKRADRAHSATLVCVDDPEAIEMHSPCGNMPQSVVFSNDESVTRVLSFTSLIKIGLLKLLKFNFTATATIAFHLVHCERVGNTPYLYKFGNQICHAWWQYLILFFLLPILVLFPLSFGLSLDLLKDRLISTNTFLLSCVLPFTTLYFQVKQKSGKMEAKEFDKEEEECIKEILEQEETLFKCEYKEIRWPTVQLYRNLLVVVLDTLVLNPVFKTLWFSALFMGFTLHDGYRKPFKSDFLNHLQRLTAVCLFLINLCSVPSCFSSVGNVRAIPNMNACLTVLRYLEILLYALVPMSLPIWKLWMLYRQKQEQRKKDI